MGHVFISYSHKDKEYVHKLQETLQNEGFEVWIDDRIDYGSEWPTEIERRLDQCDAFILIASDNAKKSTWVQNEVRRAERLGKPFFPFLLQGEPWLYIERLQWFDIKGQLLPDEKFFQGLEKFALRRKNAPPKKIGKQVSSKKSELNGSEDKRLHIKMIQDNIKDLSSKSTYMKVGLIVSLIVILALYINTRDKLFALLNIIPIILFWYLDTYYLQMERKFRGLYNDIAGVSIDPMEIKPFAMPIHYYNGGKYSFWKVFYSRTLIMFYMPVITILLVIYLFL